jgi:hypothetical protein
VIFAIVLAWLCAGRAGAQDLNGFFPEAGSIDVALSFTQESYDEFWRGTTLVSNPGVGEVETASTSLWARYGLTDRLALVATLAYVDADSDGTMGFKDSGVQDLSALVVYRMLHRETGGGRFRHTLAGGLGVRTDVGSYEADAPVSLGDGTTDGLVRLIYQFETGAFYLSQQVGYDLRGGDVPDGVPLYTELGYTFGRVTASAFYSNYSADGGTDIGDPGFTFPSNQEEFERAGLRAFVRLNDRFGLSAAAFTTLDGRNTGDSTGGSLGIVVSY